MERSEIEDRFSKLNVWKREGEQAPHKPLLALYALGRRARGAERLIPFSEVEVDLGKLLREFGPIRKGYHPEYPFWRLQADRIWEVQPGEVGESPRKSNTDPTKKALREMGAHGGFTTEIDAALRADPALVVDLARILLNSYFPVSIYADLLAAIGLKDVMFEG